MVSELSEFWQFFIGASSFMLGFILGYITTRALVYWWNYISRTLRNLRF